MPTWDQSLIEKEQKHAVYSKSERVRKSVKTIWWVGILVEPASFKFQARTEIVKEVQVNCDRAHAKWNDETACVKWGKCEGDY